MKNRILRCPHLTEKTACGALDVIQRTRPPEDFIRDWRRLSCQKHEVMIVGADELLRKVDPPTVGQPKFDDRSEVLLGQGLIPCVLGGVGPLSRRGESTPTLSWFKGKIHPDTIIGWP